MHRAVTAGLGRALIALMLWLLVGTCVAQTQICAADLDGDGAADQPGEQGTCGEFPAGPLCPIEQRACVRPPLADPQLLVASATARIIDDDAPNAATIVVEPAMEGTGVESLATVRVVLERPATRAVQLRLDTMDGTATGGLDYQPVIIDVTIPVGAVSFTAAIPIVPDSDPEPNETFALAITPIANVTSAAASVIVTVVDDDSGPVLELVSARALESAPELLVRVRLHGTATGPVTFDLATEDGSARASEDYTPNVLSVSLPLGTTFIDVPIALVNDTLPEGEESFTVALRSVIGAALARERAVLVIEDEDTPGVPPGISVLARDVLEGDSGTSTVSFTVRVTPAAAQDILIDYAVTAGTASAGADFTPESGTLTISAGTSEQTISITVNGDLAPESDETIVTTLTNATGAFGCPSDPTRACIETAPGIAACSPHACFARGAIVPDVVDPPSADPLDNGPRDADGNCLGEIEIFAGKASRCRRVGVLTGFHNCCRNNDGAITDSMGPGQIALVGRAIGNVGSAVQLAVAGDIAGANQALIAGFDPASLALSIAIGVILDMLLAGCDERDTETALLKDSRYCVFLGTYCAESWPLVGCVQRAESHCCFNSMLARIIHEQGRPQLPAMGGFGTPDAPNCRGFRPEEFQALDFSKIDLSEYSEVLRAKAQGMIQGDIERRVRETLGP